MKIEWIPAGVFAPAVVPLKYENPSRDCCGTVSALDKKFVQPCLVQQVLHVDVDDIIPPSQLLHEGHDHVRKCVSTGGGEIFIAVFPTCSCSFRYASNAGAASARLGL